MSVCKKKVGLQESDFLGFVEDSVIEKKEEKKFWITGTKKEDWRDWVGRGIALGVILSFFLPAIIGVILYGI